MAGIKASCFHLPGGGVSITSAHTFGQSTEHIARGGKGRSPSSLLAVIPVLQGGMLFQYGSQSLHQGRDVAQ